MARPERGSRSRLVDVVIDRRRALFRMGGSLAAVGAAWNAATASGQDATPAATPAGDSLIVRPNAASLSADQKRAYVDAVLALKAQPSPWEPGLSTYDTFVMWHRDAFACGVNAAHMGPAFFPWHRMYLHLFEGQLRAVDPTVTLPYWDWTVDNQVDSYVWQDDFMGETAATMTTRRW